MKYVLFFIGVAVFSVCQCLFCTSVCGQKRGQITLSLSYILPVLLLISLFSQSASIDISCLLPVSGVCFILGFAIPLILIFRGNAPCDTKNTFKLIFLAASSAFVWIASYFKVSVFTALLCALLYIAYLIFTKEKAAALFPKPPFRVYSLLFSAAGIALGCAMTVKYSIILTSSTVPIRYAVLLITALCGGFSFIYMKDRLNISRLLDISVGLILLGFPSCRIFQSTAVLIPKSICKTEIPFMLMLSLLLSSAAIIGKKHTRALGIIMLLLFLVKICL